MSNKAIAWTIGILLGVMFIYIAVCGFKSSVEDIASRPTTTYTSKCAWCDHDRLPNSKFCKDCNEIVKAINSNGQR